MPSHAAEKITYEDHVFPIFEQSCLNCHNPDKTKGGLDLSSYANTLKGGSGGKIVEAGDASSSLLTAVMRSGEIKMPPEGDAISPAQIATLKAWIEGGLLENKNATARAPKKSSFSSAPNSSAGKKPEGPPPLPQHVLLEPSVTAARGSAVRAIASSPWAPLVAVSSLRQVLLIHSESLELVGILPFPEGEPVSLAFTPDARYLIVGGGIAGKSGTTVTFDVTNGERVLTAAKEFDSILCCDIRPGFDIVATGSPSRLVKMWKTQENSLLKSIKKHTDWITSLDISPDGILLATGDRNGGVMVWEADSGGEFHTLRAHQGGITRAAFRQDSDLLGTSSEDGSIRIWEMNGGTVVKKIDAHAGGVTGFNWARNGTLASIGRDQKARLWKADFNLLRELGKLPSLPTAIGFDAEGQRVFVGDTEGHVHVIDANSAKVLTVLNNNPPTLADRIRAIDEQIAKISAESNERVKLQKSRQHWVAAQVNTQLLQSKAAAAIEQAHFEEQVAAFSAAAQQLEALASKHQKEPTEESRKALQQGESELIQLRQKIETESPARIRNLQKIATLQTEYNSQLALPLD